MKKAGLVLIILLAAAFLMTGCSEVAAEADKAVSAQAGASTQTDKTVSAQAAASTQTDKAASIQASASSTIEVNYKDGTYTAKTEPDYEGYYEKATVTVKEGKITNVDWTIYDVNREDRPFDEKYEEVFAGNEAYVQQSRNDWKGSRGYGPKLVETQDVDKVDAVSGATWTNRLFKEVVSEALKDAVK